MSPEEQLDEALAKEALRQADEANRYLTHFEVSTIAARLAREQARERSKALEEFAKLMADKSIFPKVSLRARAALAKYRGEA